MIRASTGEGARRLVSQARPIVLAVDDDEVIRDAVALDLAAHFEVVTAADGPSALALVNRQIVDAVLLDLILPGLGGLQVLREIKAIDPALPVIVISGLQQAPTIVEAMRLGADDYLTKPWPELKILTALREALGRRHRRRRGILLVGDDVEALAPLQVALDGGINIPALTVAAAIHAHVPGLSLIVLDGGADSARAGDVVHALHDRHPGCAMLVLTANPTALRLAPGLTAEVVATPYRLDEMLHRVGRLLPVRSGRMVVGRRLSQSAARAAEYIARHYRTAIALRDVAGFVGLSRDRLAHVFRHEVGMPMKEYAMRLRVAVGCRLLGESDRKLEDIAQWLGFNHASHFSRVFIDVVGVRPGEYRHRVRADRAEWTVAKARQSGWPIASAGGRTGQERQILEVAQGDVQRGVHPLA
ncbi:MAG TPA: response regulator [Methylomirabilota bacterium]